MAKRKGNAYAVRRCRQYADKFIDIQRKEFKRLGVFGDWDHPYKTMLPEYESATATELANFVEKGNVVRSKKPIYWCCSCQTALPRPKWNMPTTSRRPFTSVSADRRQAQDGLRERRSVPRLCGSSGPRPRGPLPSNMAVALHPEFEYSLAEYEGSQYVLATELVKRRQGVRLGHGRREGRGTATGQQLELVKARHPFYDRESPLILGGHVTLDAGTGCVHTAPDTAARTTKSASSTASTSIPAQ